MRITNLLGTICAAAGIGIASPALAATYDLGTLPNNTRVFNTGVLSPVNPTDTFKFNIALFGDLGSKLLNLNLVGLPSLTASFYKGTTGSGTLLKTISPGGTGNFISTVTPGPYHAIVSTSGTPAGAYNLSMIAEGTPAPVPGPAGLLVFGAGAAVIAYRKRRAKAKA